MANYQRGDSANIIVGAAALFVSVDPYDFIPLEAGGTGSLPDFQNDVNYYETLSDPAFSSEVRNVGYTSNGLEVVFQPDFGEVQVDQLLDVAKLFKQGMQVNMNTAMAEGTLENLLFAIAGNDSDLTEGEYLVGPDEDPSPSVGNVASVLELNSGNIGQCPVERSICAVGPGTGDCANSQYIERIYVGYRALSIENVTVSAKREEATMFEVSFRLLPANNGSYGRIIDRTINIYTS